MCRPPWVVVQRVLHARTPGGQASGAVEDERRQHSELVGNDANAKLAPRRATNRFDRGRALARNQEVSQRLGISSQKNPRNRLASRFSHF